MSNLMAYLMMLFLGCILVSLFYWHVVRPVFMMALRYRLFTRRDELRSLAINGDEDSRSFAYNYLENFINKTIKFAPSVCLASFLFYLRSEDKPNEQNERFKAEGSRQLHDIRDKSVQDAIMIMTVNSPIMVLITSIFAIGLWLSGKVTKMMVFNSAENYVGELTPA